MRLETRRLLIRPYVSTDVDALLGILSDPQTMSFWPEVFMRRDVQAWVDKSIQSCADCGWGRCPVFLKETGELIGDCGILKGNVAGLSVYDLGYILHRAYWGRGYATEAALAIKHHAFGPLAIESLHANMPHNHHASRRVAERIGMRFVREFINERNRNIPTLLYALDRPPDPLQAPPSAM